MESLLRTHFHVGACRVLSGKSQTFLWSKAPQGGIEGVEDISTTCM